MNRDLDIGRFLVGTRGVIHVLPQPMVSVRGHAFEQHAALQAQYNHDPFGISQRHIVYAAQSSLRKGIRATPSDNRLYFSQVVVRGLFFRGAILSNR